MLVIYVTLVLKYIENEYFMNERLPSSSCLLIRITFPFILPNHQILPAHVADMKKMLHNQK